MCTLYRKTLSVYNISRFVSSSGSDIAEAAENAFILILLYCVKWRMIVIDNQMRNQNKITYMYIWQQRQQRQQHQMIIIVIIMMIVAVWYVFRQKSGPFHILCHVSLLICNSISQVVINEQCQRYACVCSFYVYVEYVSVSQHVDRCQQFNNLHLYHLHSLADLLLLLLLLWLL